MLSTGGLLDTSVYTKVRRAHVCMRGCTRLHLAANLPIKALPAELMVVASAPAVGTKQEIATAHITIEQHTPSNIQSCQDKQHATPGCRIRLAASAHSCPHADFNHGCKTVCACAVAVSRYSNTATPGTRLYFTLNAAQCVARRLVNLYLKPLLLRLREWPCHGQ